MQGGGQKNLFSFPYDFCATLACSITTTMSPRSRRYFFMASRVSLCSFVRYREDLKGGNNKVMIQKQKSTLIMLGVSDCSRERQPESRRSPIAPASIIDPV